MRARRTFPIIEKLGGRTAVADLLREAGLLESESAVRMWSSEKRGVIPGDATRFLMLIADERTIAYTGNDFLPVEASDNGAEGFVYRDWGTGLQG